MMSSWRTGTTKQYNTYLQKWEQYCEENKLSLFNPGLDKAIEFLTSLFESGIGYSALNTARSALSSILPLIDGVKFGEHPLTCRFLKGVFELRPSLPKYTKVWDISTVLDYLTTFQVASELSLKDLSLKLVMLLCLLTAQRCQTIHHIDINGIQALKGKYRITV